MTTSVYPWLTAEARALHTALYQAIAQPAQIELIFKGSVRDDGQPLNRLLGPAAMWQEALDQAAAAGRLAELCDRVAQEPIPAVRDAVEALRRVLASAAHSANATDAVLKRYRGGDGIITINRRSLRDHLTMLADGPVRILLVRGEPRTGKSWSHRLFRHVAEAEGARFVYLDSAVAVDIDTALDTLFSQYSATDRIPPRVTTTAGWYQKVGNRLREAAEQAGQPLWVAVDEVGPDDTGTAMLDEQVQGFFHQLALTLDATNERWFRLMFIHYPEGQLPTKWPRHRLREDRTGSADVVHEDVVAVLREWADDRGRNLIDDELAPHASEVLAAGDAPQGGSRLELIHDALERKLASLAGEA
jgi:hypothetical protein